MIDEFILDSLFSNHSPHRPQVPVQPGKCLLYELGPGRDVIGLVEDDVLFLIWRPKKVEHGSRRGFGRKDDVVLAIQHKGWCAHSTHIVYVAGLRASCV